jgi:general secretion pathway protein F
LVLSDALEQATSEVKTGGGLAWALAQSKRFPRLAIQMVQVGEESGALDAMLTKVADTYDIEVKRSIDRLLGLLVPAITILMALLVGVIMLAVLLPVLDLATGIK